MTDGHDESRRPHLRVVGTPGEVRPLPEKVLTASERGLRMVQLALVQQLGPVQAYNRLLDAAEQVRSHIPEKPPRER